MIAGSRSLGRLVDNRINGEWNDFDNGMVDNDNDLNDNTTTRPKIGDLVYIPFWNSLFELSFVEDKENMMLGKSFWKMICKKYVANVNEKIDLEGTGISTASDVDAENIDDIINEIKQVDDNEREKREDIVVDEDETGFDPESTEVLNDDIQDKASTDKSDSSDFFGDW